MRMATRAGRILAACVVLSLAACAAAPAPSGGEGLRLADREAIMGALERYTRGLDQLDAALYLTAWHADGEVVLYGDEVHHGYEALAGYVAHEASERAAARERGEERIQFHQYSNQRIEFTGADTAQHRAYWTASSRGPAGDVEVGFIGSLTDTFERRGGEWKLLRREVFADP